MNYSLFRKFFIVLFISLLLIISLNSTCFSAGTLSDIVSGGDDFILAANEQELDINDMKDMSNTIYNILLTLGIIIAVIIAMVLGIQYVTAAAEDKAQIKESMIPFIIGCIVVFGAFGIWKAIIIAFTL